MDKQNRNKKISFNLTVEKGEESETIPLQALYSYDGDYIEFDTLNSWIDGGMDGLGGRVGILKDLDAVLTYPNFGDIDYILAETFVEDVGRVVDWEITEKDLLDAIEYKDGTEDIVYVTIKITAVEYILAENV